MHVLHIHETIEIKGGSEVYISLLCKYLPQFNIESDWVSIRFENFQYQLYEKSGRLTFSGSKADFPRLFKNFVDQYGYSIIHIHGISDRFIVTTCLDLLPVVRSLHEPRVFCPGSQKFFRRSENICKIPFGLHCLVHAYSEGCCNRHPKRLMTAYRNTQFEVEIASKEYAAIIVMSQYMKNEAIEAGIDSTKITVNPYFVEETVIVEPRNMNSKTILYLGRLQESKGVHYLLDAFSMLLKTFSEKVTLLVIGSGSSESLLKSKAATLGLQDNIRFLGWQSRDEINDALINSDIVAVPSVYPEAFGIVGIEAMMAGKPVVAFDVGGIADWLEHNVTGYLVPVKDSYAFSEAMGRLLTDSELYESFSNRSRQNALKQFAPSVHLTKLAELYNSILQIS